MVKGSGYSYGLGLACFALVVAMAGATQFKVGGDNGWSVPAANAESYNDWAEKTRFQIGDTLVFVYPKEKDSVLVVEPADYNACNTSSYDKKFADGNTVVTLDRSGAFFFISGVDANCRANEKLIVMVLASRNGTATAPSPAASSPPPASSSAPSPSTPTSPAPASPPPSSPSPPPASPPSSPPASPPSPSSSGAASPAAAPMTPTTPPPASSSPPYPTPSSPAPSGSSPPAPPSANAPTTNPSATSPPSAANGAVHAAVASGLAGSAAAGIIGYAMLALI